MINKRERKNGKEWERMIKVDADGFFYVWWNPQKPVTNSSD